MNEKKLYKIFEHYKKKYKLNTRLEIEPKGLLCNYKPNIDFIYLGCEAIGEGNLAERLHLKTKKQFCISALLHEIKHAIDKDILENEIKSIDIIALQYNSEYHDTLPFEIRADNFARQELKNWI